MESELGIAAKALLYFLVLGFAIPMLLHWGIDAVWVLGSIGISLAITVVPEWLIAGLKRKEKDNHAITARRKWMIVTVSVVNKKWVRISGETLFLFIIMVLIIPALEGMRMNIAWLTISAIAAPVGAVIGDYLSEKQKARKGRNSQK